MARGDSKNGDVEYKLTRGGREQVRLTAQHYMLTARQGWLLHPEISQSIQNVTNPRIADLACGTGIWSLDLAQQMPHADIVGLDISGEQFSPSWTWPRNVSLGLWDLLDDVPEELRGSFDVVHVRLLLSAGPDVDKSVFIDKFRILLKPNGWLQWDDLNWPNITSCFPSYDKGVKVVSMTNHAFIKVEAKYFAMHERLDWMDSFVEVITSGGGFGKAAMAAIPVQPHLLQIETDLCLAVMSDFITMLIDRRCYTDITTLAELQNALDELHDGANRGARYSYRWNVGIAQRQ